MNKFQTPSMKAVLLAAALFLIGLLSSPTIYAEKGENPHIEGHVIVKLEPLATIAAINNTYSTTTLSQLTPDIYLLQMPLNADDSELIDVMETDLRLSFAEPNSIGEAPEHSGQDSWAWGGQDSSPLNEQYALDALFLPQAHAISQGAGVIVAVLDTGVQLDHPALAGSLTAVNADFIDNDGNPDDSANGLDDDGDGLIDEATGHGTHVAGIIHLTAPQAQIMPVRVLNSDGQGNIYALSEAILFAADNGATVINLSLGFPERSKALRDVIKSVSRQGVVVIAAAGNSNTDDEQYPAATKCVLGVTAVTATGLKSEFANFGDWITYAAPGETVYSTFTDSSYAWWSGTSMATPFVAGQAALLQSINSTLNPRNIALLIAHTAQPLDTLNPALDKDDLGVGQPNALASLERLLTGDIPTSNHGIMSSNCIEEN